MWLRIEEIQCSKYLEDPISLLLHQLMPFWYAIVFYKEIQHTKVYAYEQRILFDLIGFRAPLVEWWICYIWHRTCTCTNRNDANRKLLRVVEHKCHQWKSIQSIPGWKFDNSSTHNRINRDGCWWVDVSVFIKIHRISPRHSLHTLVEYISNSFNSACDFDFSQPCISASHTLILQMQMQMEAPNAE